MTVFLVPSDFPLGAGTGAPLVSRKLEEDWEGEHLSSPSVLEPGLESSTTVKVLTENTGRSVTPLLLVVVSGWQLNSVGLSIQWGETVVPVIIIIP